MDFDQIKVHYEWFRAETSSWTEIGESCRALAEQLKCITMVNQEAMFAAVYQAYDSLQASFVTSTDGRTGTGYGVGAQLCDRSGEQLLEVANAYARAEAETAADLARVEKLIKG